VSFPLSFVREIHAAALRCACEGDWTQPIALVARTSWTLRIVANSFQSLGRLPSGHFTVHGDEGAPLYIVLTLRAADGMALRIVMSPADASVRETQDGVRAA